MKLTKSKLKQLIKEEIAATLLEEAGMQKYCCYKDKVFKLHPAYNQTDPPEKRYLLISCGEQSCEMLGKMLKKDFDNNIKKGIFKRA